MSTAPPVASTLVRGIALLTGLTVLLAMGGVAWLGLTGKTQNWPAVAVAALVCWGGVVGGLVVAAISSRGTNPVAGVLGGMLIRFGLPLGVGVALTRSGHWLGEQGTFNFILIFYLTLLPIETWLSLAYTQPTKRPLQRKSD